MPYYSRSIFLYIINYYYLYCCSFSICLTSSVVLYLYMKVHRYLRTIYSFTVLIRTLYDTLNQQNPILFLNLSRCSTVLFFPLFPLPHRYFNNIHPLLSNLNTLLQMRNIRLQLPQFNLITLQHLGYLFQVGSIEWVKSRLLY